MGWQGPRAHSRARLGEPESFFMSATGMAEMSTGSFYRTPWISPTHQGPAESSRRPAFAVSPARGSITRVQSNSHEFPAIARWSAIQ